MAVFTNIVEPTVVGQSLNKLTVETSVVTRRYFITVDASRERVVCVDQDREVGLDLAERSVAVVSDRGVAVSLDDRSVRIGALQPRVVVIPAEETCCE